MSELRVPPDWRRERPRSKLAVPIGLAVMTLLYAGPGLAQDYIYGHMTKTTPHPVSTKKGNANGVAGCDALTINATDKAPYTVTAFASVHATGAAKLKGIMYQFWPGNQVEVDFDNNPNTPMSATQTYSNVTADSERHVVAFPLYEMNNATYGGVPVCKSAISGIVKMEPVG